MSNIIVCTKKDGTTITALANSDVIVQWKLRIIPAVGPELPQRDPSSVTQPPHDPATATWNGVPDGATYRVVADNGKRGGDDEPVPFGNCPSGSC
jgi:hypothetical protein